MGDKLLSPICFLQQSVKTGVFFKAACALFLLCLFSACEEDKNSKKFIPYNGPLEEAENIEVLYSELGFLKVRVRTAKQIKLPSEDKIFPKKVFVDFYGPAGDVLTTLESDSGRFENRTGLYKVKGNVKVVTQKKERLFSDELTWNPQTQKVYTDKKVTIENQLSGERMNGLGLDANQDFSQYSIRKPTGFFNAPAGMSPN
ncbi:LPS export ABC transporter periplasmic protein LptC [Runella sp.]|uniref:LPS export ABC transporter periplasmic protein LptC n=1 Tax=Runella sp. TaxID=1960881 RepID=UPI003D1219A1